MADPTNSEIAAALDELGDLYELDGAVIHRIVAYRNAAKAVRDASVSVTALAREGRATELPGIGAIIQEKVLALADDGDDPGGGQAARQVPGRPAGDDPASRPGPQAGPAALRGALHRLARGAGGGRVGAADPGAQGLRAQGRGDHPGRHHRAPRRGGRGQRRRPARRAQPGAGRRRAAARRPAGPPGGRAGRAGRLGPAHDRQRQGSRRHRHRLRSRWRWRRRRPRWSWWRRRRTPASQACGCAPTPG